jgi:hypothetical protein
MKKQPLKIALCFVAWFICLFLAGLPVTQYLRFGILSIAALAFIIAIILFFDYYLFN